jgi:hypothetical protein
MNEQYCSFCGTRGDFGACGCGYSAFLDCASKISCPACHKAHRALGTFFRALIESKVATRSNSPRTRLFGVLHEATCWHRNEIREREREHVLYKLRETNSFDENAVRFRNSVLGIIPSLPLNATFAETIKRKLTEASVIRVIEKLGDELRADLETEKFNAAAAQFVRVVAFTSR